MNQNQHTFTDTIAAISTPPGSGAIGLIRLSGPAAIDLVNNRFKGKDLSTVPGHTAHFGVLQDAQLQVLDEVVVTVFKAPHSYTGEDVVEISCHGSGYILAAAMAAMLETGARMADPGEFTLRAFLNGKMDLSQAEAVADLIASESRVGHNVAMKQMRGGFSNEIAALRQQLIDFAALIELELDFGEEDVEFANRKELHDLVIKIRAEIERLCESFYVGNAIKQGVATVIAGRPNAGKSTLLNALLNEERAIVSDIAGTTRDTISEEIQIKGIRFRFVDTAGIRQTQDTIESMGVSRTLEEIKRSAILIYLIDVTTTTREELVHQLEEIDMDDTRIIVVLNKMDLYPYANPVDYYIEGITNAQNVLPLSAKNRMNVEALKDLLYHAVVKDPSVLDQTIVTNTRHVDALRRTDQALQAVLEGLQTGITGDFIAMDLRQSLYHLGSITGSISSEDLLDSIFSRFCIGK
jgi:tRNA modification GTPase